MSNTTAANQPTQPESHPMRETGKIVAMGARFISYLVYIWIMFTEVILFLGFFLLLFGANSSSGFVEWAYRALDRAMKPFRGIFTPIELGTTSGNQVESVFDTSVLFAMIIYGIIGLLVHSFIQWLTYRIQLVEVEDDQEQAAAQAEQLRQQMLQAGASSTTTLTTAAPGAMETTSLSTPAAPPPSAPSNVPPPPSSPMV